MPQQPRLSPSAHQPPAHSSPGAYTDVAEVVAAPGSLGVYEHGWQSWSPAGWYAADSTSPRPRRERWQTMAFRPGRPAPAAGFQGEGLLVVTEEDGAARLFAAVDPTVEVPSIRARAEGDRVVVSSDGPVVERVDERGLAAVLEAWAEDAAAAAGGDALPTLPAGWCSWYCYWGEVCEEDVLGNLAAIERMGLDVGVVQVDDGHQSEIGDWLTRSSRFGALADLAGRITDTGRRAGVWSAPFLVGARSRLAQEHPDWLVGGALASDLHWDQPISVLDVTHPEAAEHLSTVYRSLAEEGFTYHKADFLYAGAMEGSRHADATPVEAYREGLRILRAAIGPEATLLGCGAPLLPSIGLVDAMRVSPDVDPAYEPVEGDISQPGMRSALAAGAARTWQHGRLWINDPDCVLARPEVAHREEWAAHVAATGGLAVSSDPLDRLDERGVELTRSLLRPTAPHPVPWTPRRAAPPITLS